MVNKQRSGGFQRRAPAGGGGAGRATSQRERGDGDRPRAPRKCANCGKEHEARTCPHPAVPRDQRACWTCGKQGHSNKDCPNRAQRNAVKAIEDQIPFFGQFGLVDADGYRAVRPRGRPAPRGATLGDFVKTPTRNRFAGIASETEDDSTITTRTSTRSQPDTRSQSVSSSSSSRTTPTKEAEWKPKKTIKTMNESKNEGSVAALDSTLKSCLAEPKGDVRASSERACTADRIHAAPLGECNALRARTSVEACSARTRQTLSTEGMSELETAVLAALGEFKEQNDT